MTLTICTMCGQHGSHDCPGPVVVWQGRPDVTCDGDACRVHPGCARYRECETAGILYPAVSGGRP